MEGGRKYGVSSDNPTRSVTPPKAAPSYLGNWKAGRDRGSIASRFPRKLVIKLSDGTGREVRGSVRPLSILEPILLRGGPWLRRAGVE